MGNLSEHEAKGNGLRNTRRTLYVKKFLLIFIPLVVLFIGIGLIIYNVEGNSDIQHLLARESEENTVNHWKLIYSMEEAVADLQWMANRKELKGVIAGESCDERMELAQEFLDLGLFSSRETYDQFRVLDATGMEILRVQLSGDEYTIVAEADLQDKSDRYYFTEAIDLGQGEAYVSNIDLNVEHGEIEVPNKPVIRYATPIFSETGQKLGVLVTNLLAQPMLSRITCFDMSTSNENHWNHTYLLVDKFGHYLSGTAPGDKWGGSLGTEPLFPKMYPEIWAEIHESNIGIHKVGNSYMLSRSVHPCAEPDCTFRSAEANDVTAVTSGGHSPFLWKLIAVIPPEEIAEIRNHWLGNVALLVMILSLIGGVGSYSLSKALVRRDNAEQEIAQSRNRLQAMMDNTSSVIFLKDLDGHYLLINRKFEELFHISKTEVLGKTDFDLFPTEAAKAFQALDKQALEANAPIEEEENVPQDDGIHTYISVKFPLLGADGTPYGVCGVATDITDRKVAEEEAFKFKTIADQGSYGVATSNLEGKYTYVNRYFADAHGFTPEEMVGRVTGKFRAPRAGEEVARIKKLLDDQGAFTNEEFWRVHKDGHEFPMLASGMLVRDELGTPLMFAVTGSDITDIKQTEAKLRDSEEQLRNLFDNVSEGIEVCDLEENWLITNPAMERIHGVGPGELIGRNVREFLDSAGCETLENETTRRRAGETNSYEAHITRPDGRQRTVRITGSPRRDSAGQVIGSYGIVHDITEKQHWEHALKDSEKHYRELVEATDAVAWEIDWPSKQITYMAPQIEQLLGYPAENWKDLNYWTSKVHTDDRKMVIESCTQQRDTDDAFELEYRMVGSDGKVVWVRNLVSIVSGTDGPKKAMGLILDITQVQTAKLKAKQEYSKLKLMISTMGSGVAFANMQGKVIEINDSFCELAGIRGSDVLGKDVFEIHKSFNKRIQGLFNGVISGYMNQTSFNPYIVQRELNGKEVIFRVHPVFREGQYDGVMITIIDVTEIIEAQRKAEEATRAKSMFLANISHELRTPLTIINGFAEVLLDQQLPVLSETQSKYIQQIQESGHHLMAIISDLLDIARIEAGRIDLNIQQANLIQLCETAFGMAVPKNHGKQIEVTKDYPPNPVHCDCDPVRLRQVVINLLANAWKFTHRGSIILRLTDSEEFATITIEDTGIGIKQADIKRMLEPFEQVQNKFESEFVGTGLGLTLTKGIVEAHGGSLSATSELGVGSIFTVSLPKKFGKGNSYDANLVNRSKVKRFSTE